MSTPILSKNFFSEHAPDAGFFSKWRGLAPWAENCLPIYEWQGVLFVGCLFVPEKFPKLVERVIFVLCDPESLKEVWYEYQGTVVGKPQVILKPAPLDAPDGFMPDMGPSAPSEISMESLMLNDEISMENSEKESPSENSSGGSPRPDEAAAEETDFLNFSSEIAPPVLERTLPNVEIKATPQQSEDIFVKTKTASSKSEQNGNSEVTKRSLQTLQASLKPTLNNFLEALYEEMKSSFEKSMVLLKEGDTMKPWNWDPNFHPPSDASECISLSTPSPWRIVMKTHMPYHGYLVPNEASTHFFDSWNDSKTPDHLTLAPILVEDHVIGMVLGIGDKSADTKASLQLTERWAQEFAKQIKSQPDFCKAS